MLNIFVIGNTRTGKTPLAKRIANRLGMTHISASEWIKSRTLARDVVTMTSLTLEELQDNSKACVDYFRHKYQLENGGFVIDGIRNPMDFSMLFRPEIDVVIELKCADTIAATDFENVGLTAIDSIIKWQLAMKILSASRSYSFNLGSLKDLDNVLLQSDILVFKNNSLSFKVATTHQEITPIKSYVTEGVLYDDPKRTALVPCTIFAVSCYADHSPTFEILLDNGGVFSYVPPHKLFSNNKIINSFKLKDLVYAKCPSNIFSTTCYKILSNEPECWAYLKDINRWVHAEYITSVDWFKDNLLLHALKLDNGQFAFLPSHKVLFSSSKILPAYKKLHSEWTGVGAGKSKTAACILIRNNDLVLGVSRRSNLNDWGLPAGKVEGYESLEETAARKLEEETGVKVNPSKLKKVFTAMCGKTLTVTYEANEFVGKPENKLQGSVDWVTWNDICSGSFAEYNIKLKIKLNM